MKKLKSSSQPSALSALLKSITAVFSSVFQSSNNKDFKRLKNFIVP